MSLLGQLKRRNVLRVAAAYVALSWLVIQVVETLFPMFGLSDAIARAVVILLAIGFIPALISAWVIELTPTGFKRASGTRSRAALWSKEERIQVPPRRHRLLRPCGSAESVD